MVCKYMASEPPPGHSSVLCVLSICPTSILSIYTRVERGTVSKVSFPKDNAMLGFESGIVRCQFPTPLKLVRDSPNYRSKHVNSALSLSLRSRLKLNDQICPFTYQRRKILRTNQLYRPSGLTRT